MSDNYIVIPANLATDMVNNGLTPEDFQLICVLASLVNADRQTDAKESIIAKMVGKNRATVSRNIMAMTEKKYKGEPLLTKTKNRPCIITLSEKLGIEYVNEDYYFDELRYSNRGSEYRNIPGYKHWKQEVKKRDGCCLKCGSTDELVAHHIENYADNPTIRVDVDNGATLCGKCHIEFHKTYGYHKTNGEHLRHFLKEEND